ncbi:hypothetical protein N9971_00170 [bacterium]|nr:hypothetical protein [bacterium]
MSPNQWGVVIIGGVLVTIVFLLGLRTFVGKTTVEVDDVTNCPVDRSHQYSSTVILIDRTDAITPSQRRYLASIVNDLKSEFRLFEKVAIYPIDSSSAAAPMPLFSKCSPGDPNQANALFENPELLREEFDREFAVPFERAFDGFQDHTSTESPIVETIQAVMNNHRLDARINSQKLIVISDLLQNTNECSHYRSDGDWGGCSTSVPELYNVSASLIYLWRDAPRRIPRGAHLRLWEQYFAANGATVSTFDTVR